MAVFGDDSKEAIYEEIKFQQENNSLTDKQIINMIADIIRYITDEY